MKLSGRTFAIIGASSNRSRFSNKAIRALKNQVKAIYPVHLSESTIEELKCYHSIEEIPVRPDIISIYLSEDKLLPILENIEAKGTGEIWLNPGTDTTTVMRELMKKNIPFKQTCTIIEAGFHPSDFS